jgi:FdhE protein
MTSTDDKLTALRAAVAASPEYADIVPLFSGLYEYISGREHETGITVRLDGINFQQRISNKFSLVSVLDLVIDRDQSTKFIAGIIQVLSAAGRDGHRELARVDAALGNGVLDSGPLFAAILERRRALLDEAATAADVPPPLLEYLFEIPLRTALELAASTVAAGSFDGWEEGHCPFCGSRAGMAELVGEEGRRRLSCATCSTSWPFKRLKCAYCATENVDDLSYFTAGDGTTRVDTCKACSRYIKTRDSRLGGGDIPLEVQDLLTIHLDLLASREGFERGK